MKPKQNLQLWLPSIIFWGGLVLGQAPIFVLSVGTPVYLGYWYGALVFGFNLFVTSRLVKSMLKTGSKQLGFWFVAKFIFTGSCLFIAVSQFKLSPIALLFGVSVSLIAFLATEWAKYKIG